MKKALFFSLTLLMSLFCQFIWAQSSPVKKIDPNRFDEKAAYAQAKTKGIKASDINGYVQFLKNDFYSQKDLVKQSHKHTPYETAGTQGVQETVIYLEPNKPMSLGCPNMGFEQYNFNGWSGGTGTVSTGPTGGNPIYSSTGNAIVNPAGNNVSTTNTTNWHTIMTLPPINPDLANINGYDEWACKLVGTQTISQIPFISPFSFDPVSVRMNGAVANYRACRLKYITTTSSTNQRLSFSYAVVLENGGHPAEQSPYFKVEVKNEATGLILPGCSFDDFNPVSSPPSDSLQPSVIGSGISYRKWKYYSVDLSTLPSGTSVSVNFEVGGCSQSGHFGYAYVDAECGGIGTPYANMCSGTNFATLVAPTGFSTYQWYDPSGTLISGPNGTNDTLIQTSAIPGTTYSVNMVSPGGCVISQTVNVVFTTVNIINLNSTSSCAGGNSGSASVVASGSNGVYTYTWTNTTTSLTVSNSQTATGLAPGTYSVLVASTTCGQASANLSVGVSPPFYAVLSKSFCGNATIIPQGGGSNYIWYHGSTLIPAPLGTNDTLYINPAVAGEVYTVVYKNAQGCKDSLIYTLNQISGGFAYFSDIMNACPSGTNGATVLNLNTPFSAPYSYYVSGPTASDLVANISSSVSTLSLTSLAPGTYSAVINDGVCIYTNTVTIEAIQTNFTVTPVDSVLCFPEEAILNLNFGDPIPVTCGLSSSGQCANTSITQLGFGTNVNSSTSYPAIYSNWFKNARHQILYRASELIAAGIQAGKISSIAFNIATINGTTTYPNFTIKLKCTATNDLSSSAFDNTGLVQVYNASSINITAGWNTYNFPTVYEWDGISNILVDVCSDLTSVYTYNSSSPYTTTAFTSVRYFNSDVAAACMTTSTSVTSSDRPNIKFGNCGAVDPSTFTVSISPNGTITANYNNDSIKVAPTFTTPPTGTGSVIYTLSVINPIGGCVATQTVEVLYPPLTTTITTAISKDTVCAGANTTLSAFGGFIYNWSYFQNGGLVPISSSSSINVIPPANGINTYVVTGNAPCPGSIADTKTITINVTPMANLIITPLQDITKCMNKDFIFTPGVGSTVPANTGAPYSYAWTTLPGNAPAPGNNSSSTYTASSNTTTTLVVTVNGICSNSTSDTVVVKNFVDDLSIAITNSVITCPNKPLTLNSTTSGGYPVYNYYWSVNSSTVSSLPELNYTSPSSGGTYTVGITVIDSCGYEDFDSDVIVVLPNTLTVSILDSVAACGNTPFTLSSIASGGYHNYNYVWTLNSDVISITQNLSYITPASEGTYMVFVTASDSCGYQATDVEVINVLPPCMVIIPNVITPNGDGSNEFFKLKNLEYHPNTNVIIFDRWGRKVYENPNYNNEWKAEGVSDGTFFYVIDVPDDKKYSGFVTVLKGK